LYVLSNSLVGCSAVFIVMFSMYSFEGAHFGESCCT
jgi:hypothetical protein